MALTQGKPIDQRDGDQFSFPAAPGAQVFQGGLVMLAAGAAEKAAPGPDAATAAACVVVGVAQRPFPDPLAPGDARVKVRRGVFGFKNSAAADQITLAQVGQPAFVVDDETVAKASNNNLRPRAGTIVDVDAASVWVRVSAA